MRNSEIGKFKFEIRKSKSVKTCDPFFNFHFPFSILHFLVPSLLLIENQKPTTKSQKPKAKN